MNKKQKLILKLRESVLEEVKGIKIPFKIKKKDLTNKILVKEYESLIVKSLSYYPELKDVRIDFILADKSFFTMNAAFYIARLFTGKRKYYVKINYYRVEKLLPIMKPDGFIGVLTHELGHIVDYERKSVFGLLWFGIRYLFLPLRRIIELENELRTLYHGQAKTMKAFIRGKQKANFLSDYYKKYHDKNYFTKDDINFLLSLEKKTN